MSLRIGIDIGSTTVKVVVLDEKNKLLFRSYERHYSKARERAAETLRSIEEKLRGQQVRIAITGSAGLGVAKAADIDFVQEVYATAAAVNTYIPDTDAVIELLKPYKEKINLPVYWDTEKTEVYPDGRADKISKRARTDAGKAFCEAIRGAGYIPGVYASLSYFDEGLYPEELKRYTWWVAAYRSTRPELATDAIERL